MRLATLAAIYGLGAGMVAALVLWMMGLVSRVVWAGPESWWYVFLIIMTGGGLIASLRRVYDGEPLAEQLADIRDPAPDARHNAMVMAIMAIVAVGFGGAVGPEAGILAVVTELSALVSIRLARSNQETRLLAEASAAGALGGLYGSPPAGAVVVEEHPEAPRWQLYLAALTGLFGFLMTASLFLPEHALRLKLPDYVASGNGSDMILSLLPALFGAGAALFFALILPFLQLFLRKCGGVVVQTMIGTTLFACLAAALPILRFSGHHEFGALLEWGQGAGMMPLLGLSLLKAMALAICLAAGWRGGAAFPLMFVGAAAGDAALMLIPVTPPTAALVAGMTAALTVGMGKPVAAIFIALLILGTPAVGPLCIGAAIGWAVSRLVPLPELH
ncbi:MAG: chloride channel protein [Paracoccus sp. (in: a-proteobacteria)]